MNSKFHRQFPASRRGVSTLALVLCFTLIVALLGLSIDIGLLVQRHQQLKTASEAAALAAAIEQFATRNSRGDREGSDAARRQAARYAAANPIGDKQLDLNLNVRNDPRGDIVFGRCDPPTLGAPFLPAGTAPGVQHIRSSGNDEKRFINAVLVRTRHSQVGQRPVLLMGQMIGLCSSDLAAESIAAIDWRVAGFRPVGCTRVPLLPIVVQCRELHADNRGGIRDADGDSYHVHDQYRCDARQGRIELGQDGLPEVLLRIGAGDHSKADNDDHPGQENHSFPAEIVKFSISEEQLNGQHRGHDETDNVGLTDQVLRGLAEAHLVPFAGELHQQTAVPIIDCNRGEQELAELAQALRAIHGQPRVLAISHSHKARGQDWAALDDFAACMVVDSHLAGKSLTLRVQPAVLHTCTAITEVGARPNPGIGKIVLLR